MGLITKTLIKKVWDLGTNFVKVWDSGVKVWDSGVKVWDSG